MFNLYILSFIETSPKFDEEEEDFQFDYASGDFAEV